MNPFRLLLRWFRASRHRRTRLLIVEQRKSAWPKVDDTRDATGRHWRTVGQKR